MRGKIASRSSTTITDLRVIAGRYKGITLSSPRHSATHPMGAREKNALFNILQPWLIGATVLDAYAGSGALGIEALSRGAKSVTFVEQQPTVACTLRANLDRVGMPADIITSTMMSVIKQHKWQEKFDLIIADPPYDGFNIAEIAQLSQLLMRGGILALSYPAQLGELELAGLERQITRHYAAAGIGIYRKP